MILPSFPRLPPCAIVPFASTADLLAYLSANLDAVYLGDVNGLRPYPGAHLAVIAHCPAEGAAVALRADWAAFRKNTQRSYWRHAVRRSNKRGVPVAPIEHPSLARLASVYDCL